MIRQGELGDASRAPGPLETHQMALGFLGGLAAALVLGAAPVAAAQNSPPDDEAAAARAAMKEWMSASPEYARLQLDLVKAQPGLAVRIERLVVIGARCELLPAGGLRPLLRRSAEGRLRRRRSGTAPTGRVRRLRQAGRDARQLADLDGTPTVHQPWHCRQSQNHPLKAPASCVAIIARGLAGVRPGNRFQRGSRRSRNRAGSPRRSGWLP